MRMITEEPMVSNGRLTQIGASFRSGGHIGRSAVFQCSCGNRIVTRVSSVKTGNTESCGCLLSEMQTKLKVRHGKSRTRLYAVFHEMHNRCELASHKSFSNYGGRGIKVCERWGRFEAFVEDMGIPDTGMTIDRIDVDGDYCKENCRWSSMKTQQRNKRTNRVLTFNGESLCIADWIEKTGLTRNTIVSRLKSGWSVEKTLTTDVRKRAIRSGSDAR